MTSLNDFFQVLDLESQAAAVQAHLAGHSLGEKLAWLAERGELVPIPRIDETSLQGYHFKSRVGLNCAFCIDGDRFLIYGDNHYWTPKQPSETPDLFTLAQRRDESRAAWTLIIVVGVILLLLAAAIIPAVNMQMR